MAGRREAILTVLNWSSVRRAGVAAAIVGTIVNGINQGSEILAGHWPVLWKLGLTYLVPFLVVNYGTYSALRTSR